MSGENIDDIISQLKALQIRQSDLISRLENARNQRTQVNIQQPNRIETQDFVIGDRVQIINPGIRQQNKGTVFKIGDKYITVLTPSGSKILRAPKNLRRETD
jgi:hypothetical protein